MLINMENRSEIINYIKQRNMIVHEIRDSRFIKIEHPQNDDIRMSIYIKEDGIYYTAKYIKSQFAIGSSISQTLDELKLEICLFAASLVEGLDEEIDLDSVYEEMKYNCEMGI